MFSDMEMMVFMEELDEKIQSINDNILLLEKDGESTEVIQEIFRAAHTIKGSSGVMGYEKMAHLTHEIENLFDRLRQRTMEVNTQLVDILFEALDTLKLLKDEITGEASEVQIDDILTKIRDIQDLDENQPETVKPAQVAAESLPSGSDERFDDNILELVREAELKNYQTYKIIVKIDPECQMKNVRAFLVFQSLEQAGDIIRSVPSPEDLQEGKYDTGFTVVIITQEDMDQLKNLVMSIAEVSSVEISQVVSVEEEVSKEQVEERCEGKKPIGTDKKTIGSPVSEKTTIKTVRVDVQRLDKLMNLVSELVIDRTRMDRFVDIFEGKYGSEELVENIIEISNHLGQITTDLQDEIMKARMLPVATVFNRLPRMVRDIAQKLNKEIDFVIDGKETELDRNVIEVIGDPLIHLIRNSIDHGIETPEERLKHGKSRIGMVHLKAAYVESHILITLSDDGKGISAEKLKNKAVEKEIIKPEVANRMSNKEALDLIFIPGFSTVTEVSDVSGRGVGMDIVKNQIEQINGTVDFDSELDRGTIFRIRLPLTLVIIRALMVGMGEQVYAFPLVNVMETMALKDSDIKLIRHNEVIIVRGHVLPLLRLKNFFQIESEVNNGRLYVVVLGSGEKKIGVVVDKLIGEQEIVIKSLSAYLGETTGLSGATILGDGRVALIIDAKGIIKDTSKEEIAYAN